MIYSPKSDVGPCTAVRYTQTSWRVRAVREAEGPRSHASDAASRRSAASVDGQHAEGADAWCAIGFDRDEPSLLGLAALIGGIDHGFIEMQGLERFPVQRTDWLVAGAMTGCVLMTATTQFIPSRLHRVALGLTLLQFGLYALAIFLIDSFLVVIVNYAPVMLLLRALSMRGLGSGRGSLSMIAGIAIQFGASGVQASGVDAFTPLDHNGLYHLISMVGVVFLFHGGRHLDRQPGVSFGAALIGARCRRQGQSPAMHHGKDQRQSRLDDPTHALGDVEQRFARLRGQRYERAHDETRL